MKIGNNPHAVIIIVDLDRAGLIARITGKLAGLNLNILGISQTIMGGSSR
jgi:predicted amino acid-binding ACT domain protein